LLLALADAQEKPSLYLPLFSDEGSYRQDVCHRHDSYYNGTFELRDALEGFAINSLIRPGEYFHLDDNGAIDKEDPGLVAHILDELAKRGSFTWRNSFAVTEGPGDNHTWTELLDWAIESYDVSVDWWVHSAERYKMGATFPEGFVDSSYILVGFKEDDDGESSKKADLWTWTSPFDRSLWIAILVTVIVSGILYEVVEHIEPIRGETKKRKWHPGKGMFGTSLIVLQHFHVNPRTRAGKVLSLSLAFWSLVVVATYTANLASFFVIQNTPSTQIQSIDDAINAGISMCVQESTPAQAFGEKNYPKGIYVPKSDFTDFDGLLNGECGLVLTYVNAWEDNKIDKTVNAECDLEWIGRVISFKEAGFVLKGDSGRLCTNLVQDVLNLHLLEMKIDGTMELLKKKFQQKTQDIDCEAINAAAGADEASSNQLSLQEMAGPFLVHLIATGLGLVLATVSVFVRRFKQTDLEPDGDDHSDTSVLPMKKVDGEDSTSEEEEISDLSMQALATGLRAVQNRQDEIARDLTAQLSVVTAVLKSIQEKEASQYPKPPSNQSPRD
jgi:hypothetical protein